jgi:hypothetical protein
MCVLVDAQVLQILFTGTSAMPTPIESIQHPLSTYELFAQEIAS